LSKRTTGRPRSEKTRKAILKAAFRLLKRNGFEGVSTQQIAIEAGVSTATLYRWWDNKQAILLEAYLDTTRDILPRGKRGSALARLRTYTLRIAEFLKSANGSVFLRLLLAIQDDPALRKGFYENVFLPRRAEGCAIVEDAIGAGELPDSIQPDFVINQLIGPQVLRALLGQELNASYAQRIFASVMDSVPEAASRKAHRETGRRPPRETSPRKTSR
jgi:AcrR family transcriptional regulator